MTISPLALIETAKIFFFVLISIIDARGSTVLSYFFSLFFIDSSTKVIKAPTL